MPDEIPPYPRHLTFDEQSAVAMKAAADFAVATKAGMSPATFKAAAGEMAFQGTCDLIVAVRWAQDRIKALEDQLAAMSQKAGEP